MTTRLIRWGARWTPVSDDERAGYAEELLAVPHGLLVVGPDGELGVVDDVVYGPDGRPWTLVVATGWLGRRRHAVLFERVREVDPDSGVLVVGPVAGRVERE